MKKQNNYDEIGARKMSFDSFVRAKDRIESDIYCITILHRLANSNQILVWQDKHQQNEELAYD